MTKMVEVTNYRTEKFILTRSELVAALAEKYGDDAVFNEGRLWGVDCQTLFPDAKDFGNTEILFKVDQA